MMGENAITNYADVFKYANDILVIHHKDTGEIIDANLRACGIYGHSVEALRKMKIGDLTRGRFPFDTRVGLRKIWEARDSTEAVAFEWIIRHAEGHEVAVEVNLKRITLDGIVRVLAMARDITERKQAEIALKEKERYFRHMIDNSSDGIAILSATGEIGFIGSSIRALLGVSARFLKGGSIFAAIHADDAGRVRGLLATLKPGNRATVGYRIRHQSGAWCVHEARCRNLLHDAAVNGVLVNFRDVTERIQAEEVARSRGDQLNRMARISTTGEMAAALAHELNQPFFAIMNFVAGCRRRISAGNASQEDLLDILNLTQHEAERAGKIINAVRRFTSNRESHREICDLRAIVIDVADLIAVKAHRGDVNVVYRLDAEPCWVECDDVLIQQVIINLVVNGMDSMERVIPERRCLTISLRQQPRNRVLISVVDCGLGLPRISPERIFASFFSTKDDGLGIGLSLCRSIVESHSGHLWCTSPEAGGTAFHVLLPGASAPKRKTVL